MRTSSKSGVPGSALIQEVSRDSGKQERERERELSITKSKQDEKYTLDVSKDVLNCRRWESSLMYNLRNDKLDSSSSLKAPQYHTTSDNLIDSVVSTNCVVERQKWYKD